MRLASKKPTQHGDQGEHGVVPVVVRVQYSSLPKVSRETGYEKLKVSNAETKASLFILKAPQPCTGEG